MKARKNRAVEVSTEPVWQVVDGELRYRATGNRFGIPTAEEVYAAVFEENQADDFPRIYIGSDPPGISFSRFPAELELRLSSGDRGDASSLCWAVMAVAEDGEVDVTNVLSRDADHVVIGSRWYPFAPGALPQIRSILRKLSLGPHRLTLRQFLELQKLAKTTPLVRDLTADATSANKWRFTASVGPRGITGQLYQYQLDGWKWLAFLYGEGIGGILADEMGLGKTLQVIALLSDNKSAQGLVRSPSLIVVTGTLLENWRREVRRFAPSVEVHVHHGSARTGFPAELRDADLIITSYDTVVRDVALLRQLEWDVVVLDEAQAIKNPLTKRAVAVKRLRRRLGIAVTGTPLENRLMDLWSLVDFVLPGFLGARDSFERAYANNPHGAAALEPLVRPILLRRRIRDVARDLPERIDIPQVIDLDAHGATEYEQLRRVILSEYGGVATLVALTKLRMYCTHPFLTRERRGDPAKASSKYARLVEIVEEIVAVGEKILVFCSYNEMADILTEDLRVRFGIWCEYVDGRVPVIERQVVVDRFSNQEGAALLVLNPRAAGTGLNITAANHVIHYNLEWNPAVEDQASARSYRRGQRLPVTVHRLYYANTVEEVINDRLKSKRELSSAAVVGTRGSSDEYADILRALKASPMSGT